VVPICLFIQPAFIFGRPTVHSIQPAFIFGCRRLVVFLLIQPGFISGSPWCIQELACSAKKGDGGINIPGPVNDSLGEWPFVWSLTPQRNIGLPAGADGMTGIYPSTTRSVNCGLR
jgi:hypothetical protein